jgi:hypothetical protein
MPAVQPLLPLIRRPRRIRSNRRPFAPSQEGRGPYRLPRDVRDRLAAALAPYRNRDAAFALAVFIGRYHAAPRRIVEAFPLDRRALTEHPEIDLTERQIRSAIRVLEDVGYLDRALASGSRYKATEDGLRRKPILFVFGGIYAPAFLAANRRAAAAGGGVPGERRPIPAENARRPSMPSPVASGAKCPKGSEALKMTVPVGHQKTSGLPPSAFEPNANLEAALDRLRRGVFGRAEAVDGRAVRDSQGGENGKNPR